MEIGLRLGPNPLIERRDRPAVISRSTLSLIISPASLYARHPYYKTPSGAHVTSNFTFITCSVLNELSGTPTNQHSYQMPTGN
jgi:hypothetical protein